MESVSQDFDVLEFWLDFLSAETSYGKHMHILQPIELFLVALTNDLNEDITQKVMHGLYRLSHAVS